MNTLPSIDFLVLGPHLPRHNYFPKLMHFLEKLQQRGYKVGFEGNAKCLLSFDYDPKSRDKLTSAEKCGIPRFLIREETDAVFPLQYSREVESLFNACYNVGAIGEEVRGKSYRFPYTIFAHNHKMTKMLSLKEKIVEFERSGVYEFDKWLQRRKKPVFVGANKLISDNTLYNKRRAVIQKLQNNVEVYGENWELFGIKKATHAMKFARYSIINKQKVNLSDIFRYFAAHSIHANEMLEDKSELLLSVRFSLVFENSYNFVTEKILDSIVCGTIPIFFGTSRHLGELESLILRVDNDLSTEAISKEIDKLIETNQAGRLEEIREFLFSKNFWHDWTIEGVYESLIEEILQFS